jgi:single-strand DNA-binding protein
MSNSFNNCVLVGNITRDIELRYIPSGTAVCEFGLAVNESRKQSDGSYSDVAHFFDVTCWAKTAEIASQYCGKGSKVLVSGRLAQETWEDRNGGGKRSKVKVVCERLLMLDKKGDKQGGNGGGSQQSNAPASHDDNQYGGVPGEANNPPPTGGGDSDIPFVWLLPFMLSATLFVSMVC